LVIGLAGCTSSAEETETPALEARGTVLTTVKPTRQDLTNRISLAGKVTMNPVFGIAAPVAGEVRYMPPRPPGFRLSTRSMRVATVWKGRTPYAVEIPAGASLAGRLVADRSDVAAGMPVVSARHGTYGIVAEIDSAQAYRISGTVASVRGQIASGPGPFPCARLGTVAALPAGTIPEPPAPGPSAQPTGAPSAPPQEAQELEPPVQSEPGSEPTGLRLVCTAPADVKLINGAAVTLDVVTAKAAKALVLPVEAVAGSQGKGKVDVVGPDRTRRTTDVTLGLTDGKVIQIKSGLDENDVVAVPGPDLPEAAPGAEGGVNQSGAPG
jgi:hypothetical protein